ncbi:MAG: ABC transporter permease subunit [Halobacteriovoraceae bacterium]|jgi:microcin C transport system permease protein|nr:ABC transporter permease subunit [Halobacteriovoraceae bacterium]MBT5092661.1 ABC transporter permease subunit [Halobacteriovoraceae bacterium]
MIESFIKKEVTLKRYRRFKSRKLAVVSLIFFVFFVFLTVNADYLSNSKPLYLNYQGKTYWPVFKTYPPSDFGQEYIMVTEYRKVELGEGDSVIWPLNKWDPFESNPDVDSYPSKPTRSNWLGTDEGGRDVFARILYGFLPSIQYALLVWVFSFIIGTVFGGVMGYFGGFVDLLGQRVVEVLSTVPQFFLLIILVSIFQPGVFLLALISVLFGWISISYYIRAEFLKNRKREFVEAALAAGASKTRIIFKHILPNSLTPIITFSPFFISMNIVGLASLDYLGFGLPVPTPSWGELLSQAQKNYSIAWWLAVYPSIALFTTLCLLNMISEGVRDAMDPKAVL